MEFNILSKHLNTIQEKANAGWKAQQIMAPALRLQYNEEQIKDRNPKKASVLVLLYSKDAKLHFVLTKRASYKGTHSAQISFPGGKVNDSDKTLYQTALRETFEEINIHPKHVILLKELSKTYIPPSNFWVYPFLAYTSESPNFKKNYEVASILEVPITELFNEKNVRIKKISTSYMKNADVPYFNLQKEVVWGATAMILNELKELLKPILQENLANKR